MRINWTKEMEGYLVNLKNSGEKWINIAATMTDKFNMNFTIESCRNKYRALDVSKQVSDTANKPIDHKVDVNEKTGEGTSQKVVPLDPKKIKNNEELLALHGLDAAEYKVDRHSSSIWQHRNKEHGTVQLYASKLFVSKKQIKLTDDELVKRITKETKPIKLNSRKYKVKHKQLLEVPLMDLHFGINTLDDYEDTLQEITYILESRVWEEVLITFGSDLMHVDNLKNTTANGTRIQDVDHVQMIEDVKTFYETIISTASKQANKVKVVYIKGNHDETTSALLIHWAEARFMNVDNVEVDCSIQEVKIHTFEKVFIALSHGDKGAKRRKNVLSAKYPVEWANAKVRESHTGHLHHEKSLDEFGILERTLPTGAKTDQYHEDNSFEGAHQRFQLFEYSEDKLEAIHYV
jgi:hypothetical protein